MFIRFHKNILNFLLLLLVSIALLDQFIDSEDSRRYIVVYLQAAVLGVSLYYLAMSYLKRMYRIPMHNSILLFIMMLSLYGLMTPNLKALPILLYGITFFYPAYYLAKQEILTIKHLQIIGLLLLIIYSYGTYQGIVGRAERLDNFYERADNLGYNLLYLMPIFALNLKRTRNLVLLSITFLLVMASFKRGAMLLGVLVMALAMWPLLRGKLEVKRRDLKILKISAFVLFLFLLYLVGSYWDILIYRFVAETSGSGRDIIYGTILEEWDKSGPLYQIFGNGLYKVPELLLNKIGTAFYAHSDWYELLYDHGIFGIVVYIILLISIIKYRKNVFKYAREYYYSYLMIVAIWIPKSFFSGVYINKGTIFLVLVLGFIFVKAQDNCIISDNEYR
jgi:hypothetical protein